MGDDNVSIGRAFFAFFYITAASAQIQVPTNSRLKAITASKTIKVAYRADAKPFSFVNDKSEPVGSTIDICRLVVTSIERQFKVNHLKIEWVPVTVQTRFVAVASGKADMECALLAKPLGHDDKAVEAWFNHWIAVGFTGIERTLAEDGGAGKFCHGDRPTVADICLVPQMFNAQRYPSFDFKPFPTINRIFAACMTLDAFERARPENQPDAE